MTFRPVSRLRPKSYWTDPRPVFDLTGLDRVTAAALLRQWAMSAHLRGEIAFAAKNAEGFKRTYAASVNNLRNMCNGHRVTDYATQALVLNVAGPSPAPDESAISTAVNDAAARSTPKATATDRAMRRLDSATGTSLWPSEPSGPDTERDVNRPHPNATLIRRTFAKAVLEDPLVREYLAADPDRLNRRGSLTTEVAVTVADSAHDAGAEGFIAPGVIAGRLWVPLEWKASVHARGGAIAGGMFVCSAIEGTPTRLTQFRAVRIYIEAGDSHGHWDLSFRDSAGLLENDGTVRLIPE
jgi:hypothetical protein